MCQEKEASLPSPVPMSLTRTCLLWNPVQIHRRKLKAAHAETRSAVALGESKIGKLE
jgi:hypothetical protein